jgi:zinc protease
MYKLDAPAPPPRAVTKVPPKPQPKNGLPAEVPLKFHKLSNGLQLVLAEDHKAPVVTFQVWYGVGSRDERQGITGTSHLLEHMMFQGAKKYGKGQFDKTLLKNGGQNNAFTTENYTAYYETFASDRLEVAFDLESDRMEDALMDANQLKSEKEVVREELRWRGENSPVGATWEALVAHMFISSSLHWPVGGWPADVADVPRDDVYKHYRTYYRPDNATVVIAGDFEAANAIALAEKYFAKLAPGKTFPRNYTKELPQLGERRVELIKPVDTPVVMAGFHVPPAGHNDLYALALLDIILSSGESSRMYQSLVYKGRIAQTVETGLERGKDGSIFYALVQPLPGKTAAQAEAAMEQELAKVVLNGVDAKELTKAKNIAQARYVFARESAEGLATEVGTTAALTRPEDYNAFLPKIMAVKQADLQRVAKAYFGRTNRTVVTLHAPAKKGGK